jgi:O-antigen/teichoic acid export membrane protein
MGKHELCQLYTVRLKIDGMVCACNDLSFLINGLIMLSKLRDLLATRTFLKNILVLASGAALANVITLLFSLLITRIYSPHEYGYLGVFTSAIYMFSPAVALTLPMAIVLPKKDSEAWVIAKLSLLIASILSALGLLFIILFEAEILGLLNAESLKGFGWLVPVAIFIAAVFQVNEQWQIRNKGYKTLARSLTIRSLFIGVSQSLMGLFKASGSVLIAMYTLGLALQNLFLASRIECPLATADDRFKTIINRYSDFLLYRAPQVLLNSFSLGAPTMLLASFFGSSVAGFYTISFALLTVPVTLLGKSVGDVFYKEAVDRVNSGRSLCDLLLRTTRHLTLLGLLPFGVLALLGPDIFSILYGYDWRAAGEFAQWISLWLFMLLASRPAIAAIPVLGLQAQLLMHEVVSIAIRIGAIYLGVIEESPINSIMYLSISNAILYGSLIVYVYFKSKLDSIQPIGNS